MEKNLTHFLDAFTNISKKPYDFLSVQEDAAEEITALLKQLYDHTKSKEEQVDRKTLPQLIVHKFDEEQIWQELELQNESRADKVVEAISFLSAKRDILKFPLKLKNVGKKSVDRIEEETISDVVENQDEDSENVEDLETNYDSEVGIEGEESDLSNEEVSETNNGNKKRVKLKPSVVDDQFFKLAELELFLQSEEKKQEKPAQEKEGFDFFDSNDVEGGEGANYKYSDFFGNPESEPYFKEKSDETENYDNDDYSDEDDNLKNANDDTKGDERPKTKRSRDEISDDGDIVKEDEEKGDHKGDSKRVRFSLLNSDDEDDSGSESKKPFQKSKGADKKDNSTKSTLEQRQERLGRVIEKLEAEALSEKPWQLTGEITAGARPQNSILEEALDFDLSVRPAPVMTGEVTLRLEDIIIQRIKDKAWDDVERKVKPVDTPSEFKKKLVLDQEKSKLSLAEVYEQEYIKQREAATVDDTERQEKEPALHVEVRSMLHSLFNKLDALSNYHYTPRPVAPELKVVTNVAAINMEEVAPVTVADSALLAPQEIRGKKQRGELMSKEERTDTDKKRARRLKKTKQRQRQREREKAAKQVAKINPGLGNKYSKLEAEKQVLGISNNNVTKMEEKKEKTVRSSTAFFNKLQDEVKTQIKSKTSFIKKKDNKWTVTAKKLKL